MIQINSIYKSFEERTVLNDISFTFENGKTNLIIGQSGSGNVWWACLPPKKEKSSTTDVTSSTWARRKRKP